MFIVYIRNGLSGILRGLYSDKDGEASMGYPSQIVHIIDFFGNCGQAYRPVVFIASQSIRLPFHVRLKLVMVLVTVYVAFIRECIPFNLWREGAAVHFILVLLVKLLLNLMLFLLEVGHLTVVEVHLVRFARGPSKGHVIARIETSLNLLLLLDELLRLLRNGGFEGRLFRQIATLDLVEVQYQVSVGHAQGLQKEQ